MSAIYHEKDLTQIADPGICPKTIGFFRFQVYDGLGRPSYKQISRSHYGNSV